MVLPIAIDAVGVAIAVVVVWYVLFTRYNRRRGALVLQWVEAACATRGRIIESKWLSTSRLQAHFSFASHWFENARITIKLLPRPVPLQWIVCLWRRQRETLTFEADLDDSPNFHLEITRHRWLTQKPKEISSPERNWTVSRPGPAVPLAAPHKREGPRPRARSPRRSTAAVACPRECSRAARRRSLGRRDYCLVSERVERSGSRIVSFAPLGLCYPFTACRLRICIPHRGP